MRPGWRRELDDDTAQNTEQKKHAGQTGQGPRTRTTLPASARLVHERARVNLSAVTRTKKR